VQSMGSVVLAEGALVLAMGAARAEIARFAVSKRVAKSCITL
jgi:hypothetical protein